MRECDLFLDDFLKEIPFFRNSQKMAIIFSIYSEMSIYETVNIKWSDDININWRAELILVKLNVSNKIDNIFWDTFDDSHYTMQFLPSLVYASIGHNGLINLTKKYKKSIPIMLNHGLNKFF